MALNPVSSVAARNAMLNALTALFNSKSLTLYTSPQPAGPDTAVSTQTALAALTFGSTAFAAASGGVATANAITGATATASGTATWARGANGATGIQDFSAGPVSVVTNVALTSNVATLTTLAAHGFSIGTVVVVAGLTNSAFNGTYTITAVPTTTTFTYALTHADVSSVADAGTANGGLYDVNLGSAVINSGTVVSVTSLTISHP